MKGTSLFIVTLALSGAAFAGEVKVKIPEEGWSITFDSPLLSKRQHARKSGEYAFKANSGRFNISLFVEKPHAARNSNKACYGFYWPQASRNPMIAQDTIVTSETPKYVRVQYDIVMEFQGKPIRARNVNYYFAFRGKWADVHISVIEPNQEDERIFAAFDKSLNYGS